MLADARWNQIPLLLVCFLGSESAHGQVVGMATDSSMLYPFAVFNPRAQGNSRWSGFLPDITQNVINKIANTSGPAIFAALQGTNSAQLVRPCNYYLRRFVVINLLHSNSHTPHFRCSSAPVICFAEIVATARLR